MNDYLPLKKQVCVLRLYFFSSREIHRPQHLHRRTDST